MARQEEPGAGDGETEIGDRRAGNGDGKTQTGYPVGDGREMEIERRADPREVGRPQGRRWRQGPVPHSAFAPGRRSPKYTSLSHLGHLGMAAAAATARTDCGLETGWVRPGPRLSGTRDPAPWRPALTPRPRAGGGGIGPRDLGSRPTSGGGAGGAHRCRGDPYGAQCMLWGQ